MSKLPLLPEIILGPTHEADQSYGGLHSQPIHHFASLRWLSKMVFAVIAGFLILFMSSCGVALSAASLTKTQVAAVTTLSTFTCSVASLTGEENTTCTVTLASGALRGGTVVNLSSNNAKLTVPATVTIPAGGTNASFTANAQSVPTAQKASITVGITNSSLNFTLILQAARPSLSPSAYVIAFGNTYVNVPSSKSLTLTSSGNVPVTVTGASITGAGLSVYAPDFPLLLAPGQTMTLQVQFDPTILGAANGQLVVTSTSATAASLNIALAGTGVPIPSNLTGVTCGIATITGAGSTTCTVTVSSAAPRNGVGVILASDNASLSIPKMLTIPAAATSATFSAKMAAVSSSQTATITASAGGISKGFAMQLNAATAALTPSSTSVSFGSGMVGGAAIVQQMVLRSTGTAVLTINSGTASGSGFSFSGTTFPLTLAPGQTSTLNLQFIPQNVGSAAGFLTLTSNSSANPTVVITLSGTGTTQVPLLTGLFCNNPGITGLGSDSCSVVLNSAAPSAGMTVALASNNSSVMVPPTVTIPEGQTNATFSATRLSAGTAPTATLTATLNSLSRTSALSLVASPPIFSLAGGSYTSKMQLQITDVTPAVSIYYTTDGTIPTTSSALYTSAVSIASNMTVQAIAYGPASAASLPTAAAYTISASSGPIPAASSLVVPPADACQSPYDKLYESEPGVYAYWSMCEQGSNIDIFDYVGNWGLSLNYASGQALAWGKGTIAGGLPSPVSDNETAAQITSSASYRANVGIPLNRNQGTVATWIQTQSEPNVENAVLLYTSLGKSSISLSTKLNGNTCFIGGYVDLNGSSSTVQQCGYNSTNWYRLVMTWSSGSVNLYVNGSLVATTSYSSPLDNRLFTYRLFPACCGYTQNMTLAKALIANQAWSAAQVAIDYSPSVITPPSGGIFVTTTQSGTIHRDVLGYADQNSDLSKPELVSGLEAGLTAAGVTSLRYANGTGGITADLEDWQNGVSCSLPKGSTQQPRNIASNNNISTYLPIAQSLGIDIGYTVNYGSNPPYCDAGGDPSTNGADLVESTNVTSNYDIKYWEIGNEVWSVGTEPDFHSNPHTGASYIAYEPAFYDEMKAKDLSILIGVPLGGSNYNTQTNFDLPVMASTKYDAIIYHNYPIKDPITDGRTLYRDRVSANLLKTRGELLTLQTELLSNGKSPDALWITEWDSNNNGNQWSKQSMGAVMPLFAAGELAEYMRAGVPYATWWAQSEINVCGNSNYDSNGESAYNWWECGSASLVYTGPLSSYEGEVSVGLMSGDLMPAARAFQVLSKSGFVTEGEHMLDTVVDSLSSPWLQAYAATHGSSYAVLLINRDRDSAHKIPLTISGIASGSSVQQWTYGRAQYDLSRQGNWSATPVKTTYGAWNDHFEASLPAWSVSVFVFTR